MNIVTLTTWSTADCTIGRLNYGLFKCLTLELPWLDNQRNISCIPAGDYIATHYDSPKHGPVLLLHGVPDRDFIEVHSGNYTRDVLGCILVGDSIKYLDADDILDVTNSVRTLRKLVARLPTNFTVRITRAFESSAGEL
jgi:hypothetical protein